MAEPAGPPPTTRMSQGTGTAWDSRAAVYVKGRTYRSERNRGEVYPRYLVDARSQAKTLGLKQDAPSYYYRSGSLLISMTLLGLNDYAKFWPNWAPMLLLK